jgi:hypothetical protein
LKETGLISLQDELQSGGRWIASARIANPPPSLLVNYTQKEKDLFYDYAGFVLKVLQDADVIERLGRILAIERVRLTGPVDIRVMVFPARSFRGQSKRTLHGSFNSTASQISLYPLRIPKQWIRQRGFDFFRTPLEDLSDRERKLLRQIAESAVATLIHEIFHAKFRGRNISRYAEEAIVRKMENQYMSGWEETISVVTQRRFTQSRAT